MPRRLWSRTPSRGDQRLELAALDRADREPVDHHRGGDHGSIGRADGQLIVERVDVDADIAGVVAGEGHEARAGVDQEEDRLFVDGAEDGEMPVAGAHDRDAVGIAVARQAAR